MTVMIKQRSDKDCFLCCLAMALEMSHEFVVASLDADLAERIAAKGCYDKDMAAVFGALGLVAERDFFRLFLRPEWGTTGFTRNMLWGRRAIIQVRSKNYADESHLVYWDGAALFDPSNKRTYEWPEVEPIYLWLFRDSPMRQADP